MSHYFFNYLFLLFYLIKTSFSILCAFDIRPNTNYCVGEYLSEDTVAIFHLKSKKKNLIINIKDPQGVIIYTKTSQAEIRASLTAVESGNYEVCIQNNNKNGVMVDFELLTGVEAQDSTLIAKESSIQPAEAAILKLNEMSKELIKEFKNVVKEENKNLKENDIISGMISNVSYMTILIMVGVGLVEAFYVKKYLFARKVI
jgi:hypothetical protein